MELKRPFSELRRLRRTVTDSLRAEAVVDETESFELAASTRGFSQRTKEVVDDKLTFSATLMRAGEVEAANRLLAEVEVEVRTEEAALLEQVNEVKVARAARRERITRLRLVRTLATALLGTSVLGFSAMGIAVAGIFKERVAQPAFASSAGVNSHGSTDKTPRARQARMREVTIGDVNIAMSPRQLLRYEALTSGSVSSAQLQSFLAQLDLPAAVVRRALAAVAGGAPLAGTVGDVIATADAAKKKAEEKARKAEAQSSPKRQEPTPDPEPSDPDPQPSGDDEDQKGDDEGGDEGGNGLPATPLS